MMEFRINYGNNALFLQISNSFLKYSYLVISFKGKNISWGDKNKRQYKGSQFGHMKSLLARNGTRALATTGSKKAMRPETWVSRLHLSFDLNRVYG